jgi:hypothetical protein
MKLCTIKIILSGTSKILEIGGYLEALKFKKHKSTFIIIKNM